MTQKPRPLGHLCNPFSNLELHITLLVSDSFCFEHDNTVQLKLVPEPTAMKSKLLLQNEFTEPRDLALATDSHRANALPCIERPRRNPLICGVCFATTVRLWFLLPMLREAALYSRNCGHAAAQSATWSCGYCNSVFAKPPYRWTPSHLLSPYPCFCWVLCTVGAVQHALRRCRDPCLKPLQGCSPSLCIHRVVLQLA